MSLALMYSAHMIEDFHHQNLFAYKYAEQPTLLILYFFDFGFAYLFLFFLDYLFKFQSI